MRPSTVSAFLLLIFPLVASATILAPKALKDRAIMADHIFVGKIVRARMFDNNGNEKTDERARTPGLGTEIRLYIRPDRKEVLKGDAKNLPDEIIVPLWPMWHHTLGQIKRLEGETFIFMLVGSGFKRVDDASFFVPLSRRSELEDLI